MILSSVKKLKLHTYHHICICLCSYSLVGLPLLQTIIHSGYQIDIPCFFNSSCIFCPFLVHTQVCSIAFLRPIVECLVDGDCSLRQKRLNLPSKSLKRLEKQIFHAIQYYSSLWNLLEYSNWHVSTFLLTSF